MLSGRSIVKQRNAVDQWNAWKVMGAIFISRNLILDSALRQARVVSIRGLQVMKEREHKDDKSIRVLKFTFNLPITSTDTT